MNDFFSNNVKILNLKVDECLLNQNVDLTEDPVLRALKGRERNVERRNFSFSFATFTDNEQ